ncbi:hypothetical protein [Nocardioides speluncae]|uniref:hypothetical protein n=1 Tax=Nocardioides speluncae TaxID=2670337 RepID=UPI0012B16D5C|nr:hypothetical protein [Nocardioides speluncae]
MRVSSVAALCVLGLIPTLTPQQAQAAVPTRVGSGYVIDLATNPAGDEAMLMYLDNHLNMGVSTRHDGGSWSTPHPLGQVRAGLDIGADGVATVAYGTDEGVSVVTGSGATWSEPISIDPTGSNVHACPDVDVNADGAAVIAYPAGSDATARAVYRSAAGVWSAPKVWSKEPDGTTLSGGLEAVLDESGRATVVWGQNKFGNESLATATADSTGAFSDASAWPVGSSEFELGANDNGQVALTWPEPGTESTPGAVAVRVKQPGQPFGETETVALAGESGRIGQPILSVGPSSVAVGWTVYEERPDGPEAQWLRIRTRGLASGAWSSTAGVASMPTPQWGQVLDNQRLVPGPNGTFLTTWVEGDQGTPLLRARRILTAGQLALQPAFTVHASNERLAYSDGLFDTPYALAGSAGPGGATLAWSNFDFGPTGPEDFVFTQVIDGVGPTSRIAAPNAVRLLPKRSIPVTWTGTDSLSGVASYDVNVRIAPVDGAFAAAKPWLNRTTSKSKTYAGLRGRTYCFQVRARDRHENLGAGSPEKCDAVPLDDRDLTRSSGWTPTSVSGAYERTALTAIRKGASLKRVVLAKRITLDAWAGKGRGTVEVWLGSKRLGRVSLEANRTTRRHLTFAVASVARRQTLKVVVVSSGKPVRIDAVGASAR